jgi:cyanate lyase
MITREAATERVLSAKRARGMSFEEIAVHLGLREVWLAAALLGQATLDPEDARRLGELLGLDCEVTAAIEEFRSRGSVGRDVPSDPLLYRFFQILQIFGPALRAVIQEKFGDGVMSASDFTIDIGFRRHAEGDRVVVTFDGRFLPYGRW